MDKTNMDCFYLGVKALIHNKAGQLLLLQRNPATSTSSKQAHFDLPGGRVHKNETLENAIRREIQEEIGVPTIVSLKPFLMVLSNFRILTATGDVGLIFATYLCSIPEHTPIQISNEHLRFVWAEPDQVPELLAHYPLELLEKLSELHRSVS